MIVLSYLVGGVPFGRLIGQGVARVDVREGGSGNIGATNVARQVGAGWGVVTLLLDAMKGVLPVAASRAAFPEASGLPEAAGVAAVVGHQFSVFLRFNGGKGVATALGMFAALAPIASLLAVLVFLAAARLTRYVSLGSMVAACSMPVFLACTGYAWWTVVAALGVAGLVVLRHRGNIGRLVRGEEPRFRRGGRD